MRFQAAVLHRADEPLRIETVELERVGPHDVLIRNDASGLCHTDLEVMQGARLIRCRSCRATRARAIQRS
jgi:S-(hydroxymethyl)glutathione dehydrogenase / alcohol dehydrogenase